MKKLKNFGKALYQFRNSKNISLEKISNFTKINQKYFEEFEKGNFSVKSEVYIRLFLIEYIKYIDPTKLEEIMNNFDISYNGKTKSSSTLTFLPTTNSEDSGNNIDDSENIFNSENYTPKKIALIIATFLVIMLVFWATGWAINSNP
tara:strand:+ start:413 stop:853 length:441 start_codon:yes stop_codon:yes gene_type:complete